MPSLEKLVYFYKRGKRGEYEISQKEKDAHLLAMLILYVIPHLAPLVAKLTDDRTLENLSSDVLCADLFENHPKSKAAYIEAEKRIGNVHVLVSKLKSRRLKQLGTIATLQKEYRRVRSTLFRADTSGPDPDAVHDLPLGLEPGVVHVLEAQAQADDGRGEREGTGSWLHTSIQSEGTDTAASTFWLYKFG